MTDVRRVTGDRLGNTHPALRAGWHPVARSDEVGTDPVAVMLLGEAWALVRLEPDAPVSAWLDVCPHRLAPLSAGRVDDRRLRCGYHGWCFDAAGTCVEIPSNRADAAVPARARATVPAGLTERHDLVWLAPEPPLAPLLDEFDSDGDDSFLRAPLEPTRATVSAGLMIDNFLDMAHFPFVHAATIGTPESAVVHDLAIDRDGFGMVLHSEHPFPNHEDPGVAEGVRPLVQTRRLTYTYRAPFSIRLRIDYLEAGGTNVIDFFVQPEDADHCRLHTVVMRNDLDGDRHRLADALSFEQKVLEEDLGIQERFRNRSLPLDLTAEMHVRADRMTVELRRILADFVAAAASTRPPRD